MTEPNMPRAAKRSLQVFPAGSNGELNLLLELCTAISRGKGCEAEDTSGAAFLDFSMGWDSVLVGHARPEVDQAVVRQAALGANFGCMDESSLRRDEIRWRFGTGQAERQRNRLVVGMACKHMEHQHQGGIPRNESACAHAD